MRLYDQQLNLARAALAKKGPKALEGDARVGEMCKCRDCYCCAAARVLRDHRSNQLMAEYRRSQEIN